MTRPLLSEADRADVFRGLAHPMRRKMLALLKQKQRTVGELLDLLGGPVTMPTLSRHLGVLRDAGLVTQAKEGQYRVYRLERGAGQQAIKWLKQTL